MCERQWNARYRFRIRAVQEIEREGNHALANELAEILRVHWANDVQVAWDNGSTAWLRAAGKSRSARSRPAGAQRFRWALRSRIPEQVRPMCRAVCGWHDPREMRRSGGTSLDIMNEPVDSSAIASVGSARLRDRSRVQRGGVSRRRARLVACADGARSRDHRDRRWIERRHCRHRTPACLGRSSRAGALTRASRRGGPRPHATPDYAWREGSTSRCSMPTTRAFPRDWRRGCAQWSSADQPSPSPTCSGSTRTRARSRPQAHSRSPAFSNERRHTSSTSRTMCISAHNPSPRFCSRTWRSSHPR